MATNHSLDELKHCHNEASQFFASELTLLKEVIPKIEDDRLAKTGVLLMSCGQTGAALLQLANQTETFTRESAMLARTFMETITNFCYVGICDEQEYRAFLLHPIYKHYHNVGSPKMEDDFDFATETILARKEKQEKLKKVLIVQEALTIFSDTKPYLSWTKKKLHERIEVIQTWGKLMDAFFTINKIQYYSDASEALHGSLYGCTYNVGTFDPDFSHTKEQELEKKLYKDSSCVLLHLGILVHQSFTLISYSNDINEIWKHSYENQRHALNLLFHIMERDPKG